jgi:hypothetical protein
VHLRAVPGRCVFLQGMYRFELPVAHGEGRFVTRSPEDLAALDAAGLSFSTIRAMKPEDAFNATVAAVAKIPDPMTQSRVALELFGKAGADLLPAIRNGFDKVAEGAAIMSKDTIKRLDDAKDVWEKFKNNVIIFTGEIIGAIVEQGNAFDSLTKAQQQTYRDLLASHQNGAQYIKETVAANRAAAESEKARIKAIDDGFATMQKQQVVAAAQTQSVEAVAKAYGLTVDQVKALMGAASFAMGFILINGGVVMPLDEMRDALLGTVSA